MDARELTRAERAAIRKLVKRWCANYDPEYWAKLIKESGAKYTVITTKHHDGFALWDTKAGDVSSVKSSPAKRDVCRAAATACCPPPPAG